MTDRIDSTVIGDVLRCYEPTRDADDVSFPAGGFSGAVVARVRTSTGEFCLRGWPINSLPAKRIRGLHRLLRHVFQQGVTCVAVPLESIAGDTLLRRHERYWQLEPWLPGTADFWSNPGEPRLRAAARSLANWHRAAASFVPDDDSASWFSNRRQAASPAVGERLERIRRLQRTGYERLRQAVPRENPGEFHAIGRHILDLFPRVASAVESELTIATQSRFDLQPCLRDVWHDHVLFAGDDVTGLIDASACRSENVATDLARLFGSLIEDDRDAWDIAIDEYRRHADLSISELALVQVLDRSTVVLAGMTWLARDLIEKQVVADNPRVVSRLMKIASRLGRLL